MKKILLSIMVCIAHQNYSMDIKKSLSSEDLAQMGNMLTALQNSIQEQTQTLSDVSHELGNRSPEVLQKRNASYDELKNLNKYYLDTIKTQHEQILLILQASTQHLADISLGLSTIKETIKVEKPQQPLIHSKTFQPVSKKDPRRPRKSKTCNCLPDTNSKKI